MVYPVDLRMIEAMARHDAAGHAKDAHEYHRRDLILQQRAARRQGVLALLRRTVRALRGLAPEKPKVACAEVVKP